MSTLDVSNSSELEATPSPSYCTSRQCQQEQSQPLSSASPAQITTSTPSGASSSPTSTSPGKALESRQPQHNALPSQKRSTASYVTVSSSHALYSNQNPNTASSPNHRASLTVCEDTHKVDAATAAVDTFPSSPQALQMVVDLRNEVFHPSRQLTQARQQARMHEEACNELRQRCQGLEVETQSLTLQLQEAQSRLQTRQTRLDEHRREAADAALKVVSLTAERDELSAKVQEAWDRVAELSSHLRSRDDEVAKLQAEVTEVRHSKELVTQQQTTLESQVRLLQEQVNVGGSGARAQAAAHKRMTSLLHEAVQRLAGILSDVAYDYQQSITGDTADNNSNISGDSKTLYRITSTSSSGALDNHDDPDDGGRRESPPHVILSPAYRHPNTSPRRTSPETSRLHSELLLHNAEAILWGGAWNDQDEEISPPLPSSRPSVTIQNNENQQQQLNEGAGTAATPPERKLSSASAGVGTGQVLVNRCSTTSQANTYLDNASDAGLSEKAYVRTALGPILLAMKHFAAMLGTVRREHRRTAAEATHVHAGYEKAKQQLEAMQQSARAQETRQADCSWRVLQLQREAAQIAETLRQFKCDDDQRRTALAQMLQCREDWPLIQHSVERLLVRQAELTKDVAQLQTACSREREKTGVNREQLSPLKCQGFSPQLGHTRYRKVHTAGESTNNVSSSTWLAQTQQEKLTTSATPAAVIRADDNENSGATTPSQSAGAAFDAKSPKQGFSFSAMSSFPSEESPRRLSSPRNGRTPRSQLLLVNGNAAADVPAHTIETNGKGLKPTVTFTEDVPCIPSQTTIQLPVPSAAASQVSTAHYNMHPTALQSANTLSAEAESYQEVNQKQSASQTPSVQLPEAVSLPSPWSANSSHPPVHTNSPIERHLFEPLYGDLRQSTTPCDPPPPLPLPVPPSASYLPLRNERHTNANADSSYSYSYSRSNVDCNYGSTDQSSTFAAEVLQVIEALDRRVSGALHRTPR